jgi:uncharacterized repeat protein (TIGR01451 family)
MNETTIKARGKTRTGLQLQVYVFALAMLALLAFTAGTSFAAAPSAGTPITNQATATYSVAGVLQPQVQSNAVTTTVLHVASFTLDTDGQTKNVTVGGTVYFQHYITNTGNDTDVFTLGAAKSSGTLNVTNIVIYADDQAGNMTASVITQTPAGTPIPINGKYYFWVADTVSNAATNGQLADVLLTATSKFDNTKSKTNTEHIVLSAFAVVAVTKSVTNDAAPLTPHGKPTDTATYSINYVNSGTTEATNLVLTDTIPAGMTYIPGSAKWNGVALNDNGAGNPPGITFATTGSPVVTSLSAIVATVNRSGAGDNGTLTFRVTVGNVAAGSTITNLAGSSYVNGNAVTIADPKNAFTLVGQTTLAPYAATGTAAGDTVTQVTDGGTVWFQHLITTTGNAVDSYTLSVGAPNSFPALSTYTFYADNAGIPGTQLTGAGSNTTGSVAALGGTTLVWVKVVLPTGSGTINPSLLTLTAASVGTPAWTRSNTDTVTRIAAYSLTLSGPYSGTAVPGGTKVYGIAPAGINQLCNTSNIAVGTVPGSLTISFTDSNPSNLSSGLYVDSTLLTPLTDVHQLNGGTGLAAGQCATIYVKVTAFATASGQSDTTTIIITDLKGAGAPKVVVSTTDVTNCATQSSLTILKSQAVDASCTADITTLGTYASGPTSAVPGACIAYKLVVTNPGTLDATAVTVTDTINPVGQYTAYSKGSVCTGFNTPATGSAGASGTVTGTGTIIQPTITEPSGCSPSGTVTFANMTIPPSGTATLYFRVQIVNF